MIQNILSSVIGNMISIVLIILVGWMIYWIMNRRKLLIFFNIKETKRLVIYLSKLLIRAGGSTGTNGILRNYQGVTTIFKEQLAANKFRDNFNYLMPALSESPSLLSKILFADIEVITMPSVDNVNAIDETTSIISLGSPGYNRVSSYIENYNNSTVRFSDTMAEIRINDLQDISDLDNGFIQRIVDNKQGRSIFYTAGLSEWGTVGTANFLADNWKKLYKKYKGDKSFIVMLRFANKDPYKWTIDFEWEIN